MNYHILVRFGHPIAFVMEVLDHAIIGLIINTDQWVSFGTNHEQTIELVAC